MNLRKSRVKLLRVAFCSFALLALLVAPYERQGINVVLDFTCHWTGYVLLMAGLGLRMWAILYVGQRKSRELTTTGPYSLCRNPLYVGTFLLTLGTALSFENVAMLAFAVVVVIPIHVAVVLAEEKHLRALFGEQYVQYMQRTPRFWFRLSAYNSAPEVNIPVRTLRRAIFDAVGILCIPPLASLVDTLQDNNILPVLWHWP